MLATLSFAAACWLIAAWLFAVGGAVGSFLNVVVYRLPRGMSIVTPGSHCPACNRPIRWFDNVPIFAWLWLRGRCRDCRAAISPRYCVVETLTAVLFLVLGAAEGLSGGANLPLRSAGLPEGTTVPGMSYLQLAGICVYHLLLLGTLLCATLIELDGHRPPLRLFAPALAVGMLAPLAWPYLHAVRAWEGLDGFLAGGIDGAAGLAAGGLLGCLWLWCVKHSVAWLGAAACAGLYLGWQAACVLVPAAAVICLLLRPVTAGSSHRRHIPAVGWLAAAALAWILAWAWLVERMPWLG